jgi:ribosomal protein S18 acetylase RimI-like enzyme
MLQGYAQDADAFTTTAQERASEPIGWWLKRICDRNGLSQAFGAFYDDSLVGGVAIEYSARYKVQHKAHLVGMFVSEQHRHLGAGRALLLAATAHARSRAGVRVVTLTMTEGNAHAVRLYESAGFRQFGLEALAIFTGTEYKSKVHMQLELPST